jgi:hypothetical protein
MHTVRRTLAALAVAALALLAACNSNVADAPPAQQQGRAAAQRALAPAAAYGTLVQQLYIAYFGRPADTGGLANFSARLAQLGAATDIESLTQAYQSSAEVRALIDGFGSSAESAALYSGDTAAFVTAIYNNVLGRGPDEEGKAFWVGKIDAGLLTRANASLSIMAGALRNTSAQGLLDAVLVNKRVSVGTNFTVALDTAAEQAAYAGDAAAAGARAMLGAVTANTDVAAYQPTVEALVATLVAKAGPAFSVVRAIVNQRCIVCHSGSAPSGGVSWVSDALVKARAADIDQRVFVERSMPFGNATNMTVAERETIHAWFLAGGN